MRFRRVLLPAFFTLSVALPAPLSAQLTEAGKRLEQGRPADAPGDLPPGYELRCRGGDGAFHWRVLDLAPHKPHGLTLRLRFVRSERAAGAASEGLEQGTCSWIDRPINDAEPLEIQFETVAPAPESREAGQSASEAAERSPDADSIPAYLRDPAHYWSFFVHNTNEGYFITTRHQPWKPLGDQAIRGPAARRSDRLQARRPSTVSVEIRYPSKFGRAKPTSAFGDPPGMCSGFAVSVSPDRWGNPPHLVGVPTQGIRTEAGEDFYCEYEVTGLPLDALITISVGVHPTEVWLDGSEPAPSTGLRRLILEPTRTVTLKKPRSWATLTFEMVYAP